MGKKALGAAFSHARASGKDQSQAAQRRRANEFLRREGKATMSRKVAKGILDRWRAMTTDERADEFNLRAAGVPPDVARALAMTGNGKAPKRKPKFGGLINKMGPTLAELDAPGHSTGLTGSQALRGATWRKRRRQQKRIDKGGPGSGPHAGGGTSVASHLSAARSHLAAAKLARGKGEHATADSHQQRASARIQAALTARSVTKAGDFDESKHPRADNGEFGEGSGSSAPDAGGAPKAKISTSGKLPRDLHNYSSSELHEAIKQHTAAANSAQPKSFLPGNGEDKKLKEYKRLSGREDKLKKELKEQSGNYGQGKNGLSHDEIAALHAYSKVGASGSGYKEISAAAMSKEKPSSAQDVRNKRAADNLVSAIDRQKTAEDMQLHRGTHLPENLSPGDTVPLRGFSSFDKKESVAARFAASSNTNTILHMTAKKGSNLLDVHQALDGTVHNDEQEFLAGPKSKVTVDKIAHDDKGVRHVYATLHQSIEKHGIAKRHMVSQIAGQMIAAAYEEPRLPAGAPTYTDPPEFARYLDAQRLVAGMDTEMSVDGTQTAAQARVRASRALATSMGAYDRTIAGQDRSLAHVGGLNLDLGSGQARERGYLGLDTYPYDYGTVVADLGMGIPFPDASARAVRAVDALPALSDYVDNATPLMLEVQRVLGIGGRFYYRGPPLQDIVDWAKLPGLGVVSHQFSDGGKTLSLTLQRQAARLPLVYGADVEHLGRTEALPSDIAESRAEFGDLPPASVAMANLVAKQHVELKARVVKKESWQRTVLGVVLVPSVPDSQNDVMTAADIEETAHNFLADARIIGREHSDTWEGAQVVESYIAPSDLNFADEMYGPQVVPKGSWILGVRLPAETWNDVLSGDVTGFSVGGWGEREDLPAANVTA